MHTAAYTEYDKFPINRLNALLWRSANLVLVHNEQSLDLLRKKYASLRKKIFVLEDPLPDFPRIGNSNIEKWKKPMPVGVLVSRFSSDEPVESFLQATRSLSGIHFYITGNSQKAKFPLSNYSSDNISFTGFLPDHEYFSLLMAADFIVALTTRENTLLSAGYEALSLEKPLVVSDTKTLRAYFNDAVIYVLNEPENIKVATIELTKKLESYRRKMMELKDQKEREWNAKEVIARKRLFT